MKRRSVWPRALYLWLVGAVIFTACAAPAQPPVAATHPASEAVNVRTPASGLPDATTAIARPAASDLTPTVVKITVVSQTDTGKTAASIGLDFVPVIGDVKGVIEAGTGYDLVTGESLGNWRWFGLLGLVGLAEVGVLSRGTRRGR